MRLQQCQVHPYTWDVNNFHIGNFNDIYKISVTLSGPPAYHQVRKMYAILWISHKNIIFAHFNHFWTEFWSVYIKTLKVFNWKRQFSDWIKNRSRIFLAKKYFLSF